MAKRFSTSTLTENGEIVPWLAATGPLAYTPENPPERDYFFQYGWVIPEVINPETRKKAHFYFGHPYKDESDELFRFWKTAREGQVQQVALHHGRAGTYSCAAPMAVYRNRHLFKKTDNLIFIQHGSYQIIEQEEQPHVQNGYAIIYRAIGEEKKFRHVRYDINACTQLQKETVERYFSLQNKVLSDSVQSFNVVHDSLVRSETGGILNDRTRIWDSLAAQAGLNHRECPHAEMLRAGYRQCFSLVRELTWRKFGPNYVIAKTPLTNLHLTTHFANEFEVKVLDPNQVEFLDTIGCEIEFVQL